MGPARTNNRQSPKQNGDIQSRRGRAANQ